MDGVSQSVLSEPFMNGFWVFIGVIAGAIVQFLLHQAVLWQQRSNARRLFRVEIEINEGELERLEADVDRKMRLFSSRQHEEIDFFFDMGSFNYRMLDPLINSGHFHSFLGKEGVSEYFKFANELNVNSARNLELTLRERDQAGTSVRYLEWVRDKKLPEWRGLLSGIKAKL